MAELSLDLKEEVLGFNEIHGHSWPQGIAVCLCEEMGISGEELEQVRLDVLLQEIREEG